MESRWGPRRWIPLLVALCLLAGAIGFVLGQGRAPGRQSVTVGFLDDMITHHEQAVQMAILELANGEDERVRVMAREILQQQSYEIGVMDRRLQEWGYERANRPGTAMAWMGEPVPATAMPGLASAESMAALGAGRGAAADALFLELMTAHHVGGVHMASYAAEHSDDGSVRRLADRMARLQRSEINEMAMVAGDLGVILAEAEHQHGG